MGTKGGIAKFIEEAKNSQNNPNVLNKIIEAMSEKIDELEAKAAAYDRLMSGEYTLKDMSNIFQMYSAIDADGYARLFADPPFIDRVGWSSNFPEDEFSIPGGVKHTGNWETSLTVPDGWEESNAR